MNFLHDATEDDDDEEEEEGEEEEEPPEDDPFAVEVAKRKAELCELFRPDQDRASGRLLAEEFGQDGQAFADPLHGSTAGDPADEAAAAARSGADGFGRGGHPAMKRSTISAGTSTMKATPAAGAPQRSAP
eukprot:s2518_g13.t2